MSDPVADAETLPFVRAADLADSAAERPWLVESLWAHSAVGIVGGAPKCCKSWLALDMALSVSSGTPCLGAFAVPEPGGALIYMAEDATATVRQRLDGLCRQRRVDLGAVPLDVITAASVRLDLGRDQQRLAATVRRVRPRLLVLDPFVRLQRIDENDARQVSAVLAYLRDLERQYDLAVVLVHHARKNHQGVGQDGQSLRGSGDLHAWGDSNLYLRRQHDHLMLTVEHRASPALAPCTLALVSDDEGEATHLTLLHPGSATTSATEREDLDARLLDAVARVDTPVSRTQLRETLHVRNERLGEALSRLAAKGLLARSGDRWLRAPGTVPVPPP